MPVPLTTPVALFFFNRPEQTRGTFRRIAAAKPAKLFLIGDGPRHEGDAAACAAAREAVATVDWPCDICRIYSDRNMGCRARMATGIDAVFAAVPEAILLEDDCLPDPTFFPFCEQLLQRYREDERVGMICGSDLQFGRNATPFSYRFSTIPLVWGWATWRRAWQHYDVTMKTWSAARDTGWLATVTPSPAVAKLYATAFDRVHRGEIDTWDYQWNFALWQRQMLTLHASANLIANTGFDMAATHTKDAASRYANLAVQPMEFPLRHPPTPPLADRDADAFIFDQLLGRA